jgi:aromatic ring-opening dioxygenase catalytic subunit (LigB family)
MIPMPATIKRLPTYFLSHGGGPWPWMKSQTGSSFDRLEQSLLEVRQELGELPRAVLTISGHWESDRFLASSSAWPPMVYDYYGFPEEMYHICYDAPGAPGLATEVAALLSRGGMTSGLDPVRGFNHGTFSMMKTLYPDAQVPIVQLSLREDYDPAAHLEAGRLIAPLRDEGVLIVGSGSSYHDLRGMRRGGGPASRLFDAWLDETLVGVDAAERRRRLIDWTAAPAARAAHPREDHLMPLMVAVGAAGDDAATRIYHQDDFMDGITMSSFRFGDPVAVAVAAAKESPQSEI